MYHIGFPSTEAVLLLPGEVFVNDGLTAYCANRYIVAVDGGIVQSRLLTLSPDVWIGDFDSTPSEFLGEFLNLPRLCFPVDKDFTDTELALKEVEWAKHITLIGGLAGRVDHLLSLLTLPLSYPSCCFLMTDGKTYLQPLSINTVLKFSLPVGTVFSIMALSPVTDLSIQGAKWSTDCITLLPGEARCLSNMTEASELSIHLTSGSAWLVINP